MTLDMLLGGRDSHPARRLFGLCIAWGGERSDILDRPGKKDPYKVGMAEALLEAVTDLVGVLMLVYPDWQISTGQTAFSGSGRVDIDRVIMDEGLPPETRIAGLCPLWQRRIVELASRAEADAPAAGRLAAYRQATAQLQSGLALVYQAGQ